MKKKAQGLPITTIALIIIVIIVLAAVAIFFFVYMGKGQGGVNLFNCQQLCQSEKSRMVSTGVSSTAANTEYCKQGCKDVMGATCAYNTTLTFTCA